MVSIPMTVSDLEDASGGSKSF